MTTGEADTSFPPLRALGRRNEYHRGALSDETLTYCQAVGRSVCADFEAELREFNEQHDHLHLLVFYPPKIAISALVNSLKGVSARMLRSEFTGRVNKASVRGHFWSPSYFAASCGGTPLSIINQ